MDKDLLDELGVEELRLTWWQKLLMKFWPWALFKILSKQMKIQNVVFDKLHDVFSESKTIDIFPFRPANAGRGFMLVIDRETALYFYQDGDHFKYDGFEMGPYEKGDVTIFDNLKSK